MDDPATRLLGVLDLLQGLADEFTAEEATTALDDATLQTFWREWPRASAWAAAMWRALNADLEGPAEVAGDPDLDEFGGGD